ncbi:MAG: DUF3667 domain-containing protein [Ginsengibacter sp.]
MSRNRIKSQHCNNCGYDFKIDPEHNNFCPNCGQENHNSRSPLSHYILELLDNFFHFDSKTFKTYRTLLFKPGQLTIDYLHNKRARYVAPLRLFIFTLAIFIIVLFMIDKPAPKTADSKNDSVSLTEEFDKLTDSTLITLNGPFPWSGKSKIPVYRLRELKKAPRNQVVAWLNHNHLSQDIFNRLYFMSYREMVNDRKSMHQYLEKKNKIKYGAMFFLTPLLAAMLLLFFNRKGLLFYDMLVFGLHIMTYWMLVGVVVALVHSLIPKAASDYNMFPILYPTTLITILFCIIPGAKKVFELNWFSTVLRLLLACAAVLFIWITSMLLIEAFGLL